MKQLLLTAIMIAGITILFSYGMNKQERIDCNKWNEQSTAYANYYVTEWQVAQCNAHGIHLTAPVLVRFEDGSSRTFTQSELYNWYNSDK